MENLKIDKETAKKIYPTAPAEIKLILEQSFGKGFFSENIMDRVKSVEDAISVLGEGHEEVVELNKLVRNKHNEKTILRQECIVLMTALNQTWIPNWCDSNEEKHYPVYIKKDNKLVFIRSDYRNSNSHGGLYLCFHSKALSNYFGKTFDDKYNKMMLNV
jgi:hypothetical protein